ncbi:hypothetical protein [Nostoc sp. UHCC 0870]|uniref:hypothetical protein n=1 Tax=Nostoc sp. UHCC 0870 TaxID=2914041 RepID=UPI001EDD0286|nr:hypothetical protein [Nostoc sp. UHCC 0870]UKO99926.1 hypothetical protein L6494_09555 [Nostoc sp. UHCC 0870]
MFSPTITSDLLMDLSTDEQQLLAGGKKQRCGGVSDDGEASQFKTQNGGNGNGGGFSAMLCYRITATPSFQCGNGNGNGEEEGDEGMES